MSHVTLKELEDSTRVAVNICINIEPARLGT